MAAKRWQRVFAALLSAAAERDEATRRLADVLIARDIRVVVEGLGDWWDALVDVTIGELCLNTSGGPDSIVLALAARQHAAGEITAAREWVRWATSSVSTEALRLADVALAFSPGDDAHVLTATDGLSNRDAATIVLQTYRARALQRTRRMEPAILVLTEAMTLTRKLGDEHAGRVVPVRYLRARALLAANRTAEAVRDLHAIQAAEADYLDVADVLAAVAASEPRRRREIPEHIRHEVWRRDQGRCVQCAAKSNSNSTTSSPGREEAQIPRATSSFCARSATGASPRPSRKRLARIALRTPSF